MVKGTINRKGQVALPKEIRDALGLKPGSRVASSSKVATRYSFPNPKAALGHRVWSTLRMQKPKFSLVMAGFLFYLFLLAVPLLIALAFWRTL